MLDSLRSLVQLRKFEFDRVERRLATCGDVNDLRNIAKRLLPAGVFDYIDGGAEGEISLAENVRAYERLQLHANVLRDVSAIDTSTTLFGKKRQTPILLAPTGFTRIAHPQGELAVGRAAAKYEIPYTLSTLGTRSIEELAAVAKAPLWFQVYVWKDRGLVKEMIQRSAAAGYEALAVTVDTAVLGRRERDVRRGFTLPPKIGPETFIDGALHPEWTLNLLRNEPITFANVRGHNDINGSTAITLSDFVNKQFDQALSWESLEWIRAASDMKIVLKGIQRVEDAKRAADLGIDAVGLSNHGGRQLDGGPAPVSLLPQVVDAVGDRIDVICDGGVRRGSDIVKACALGANAVMVGRPYLYALAAGGERGVEFMLDHLVNGLKRTMALVGRTNIAALTPDLLDPSKATSHIEPNVPDPSERALFH
jgi:L-lactate dehydrogenase (cytochrome)